jgi:hypothetical protein
MLNLCCRRKDLPQLESPNDWVVQDRVPARKGIDERAWDDGRPLNWADAGLMLWKPMPTHGTKHNTKILHQRCRRKDLPPLQNTDPLIVKYGEPAFGWRWLGDDEPVQQGDEWLIRHGEFLPTANHHESNNQSVHCRPYRRRVSPVQTPEAPKTKSPEQPKQEPATRTVILKQWIVCNELGREREMWSSFRPIAFTHAIETGQTKEVVIPINPK